MGDTPRGRRTDARGSGDPSWPACAGLDDATLVVRAREGDIGAFEALVRRYRVPVYRIAARILTDPSAAADTAQEAFITAFTILARGGAIVMYCEGGRSRTGAVGERARPGIGRLALESGAPVVPIT